MSGNICLILTTVDSEDAARHMASDLVEQRLAACVQMLPGVRSLYRWQAKTEQSVETLLQIKTTPARADDVVAWLEKHHPYELPEIVRLDGAASRPYAAWASEATMTQEPIHD
jgi:periplasmic divalent cation tolerance protein